jgi:hypothetical protein
MIRLTLFMAILVLLTAGSCSSRKNKPDRSNLIPEKELVSILTDIHIANGILSIPKIQGWFSTLDSTSTYYYIIKKHGYTKETMDKTMKYYFIKKPKELIKIYDEVLADLSKMESLLEKEKTSEEHKTTLWTGKDYYAVPDKSADDSPRIDITLNKSGTYILSYFTTLFPDDQSLHPRFEGYSCNADSIETGKREYFKTINYIKDSQPHKYTFKIIVPLKSNVHIQAWLFYSDNHPDETDKHALFENISFTYTPVTE